MTEPDDPGAAPDPPTGRGYLFMLLRELGERAERLAYLVLHQEASTGDLDAFARECSAMSGALHRYAATLPGGPTITGDAEGTGAG